MCTGQEVKVSMEYDRKTGGPAAPGGASSTADTPERTMSFATVRFPPPPAFRGADFDLQLPLPQE